MIMTAPQPTKSQLILRPYQEEAIEAVNDAAQEGVQRPLVALPTGTGKTVIFAHLLDQRPGRSLVLAHRDELLRQCQDKLLLVNPDFNIGVVKAGENETGADVVVASVQTLSRSNRLQQVFANFNTVVVDEAHHAVADTYRRVLEHGGSFADGGPLTVGFTATPERGDKRGLRQVWDKIVYQKDILDMILQGYLCDLKAVRVSLRVNLDRVKVSHGDFIDSDLESALLDANAPKHVANAYLEHAPGRKALLFTPTVKVAYEMADAFRKVGVKAEALDGTTPAEERRAMLKRFHSGETMVLSNCAVLTEGFDEPSINCIITVRPTKSRPFYLQMIGRGTRVYPGKSGCLILDVVGSSQRHQLVTANEIFDMDLSVTGRSVREQTEHDAEIFPEDAGLADLDGRLVSTVVDLFSNRDLHWQQTRQGAWVLSMGSNGLLRMVSAGEDAWSVSLVRDGECQLLKDGLPLTYAQGFGEDFARKCGLNPLLDPNAPWRRDEATEKQLMALRRWKVPVTPGLTKGAASDLLAAVIGDR
jgi:ATP-dependent helicase IRC3